MTTRTAFGLKLRIVGANPRGLALSGGFGRAITLGLTPFPLLDVVKAFAAAWIAGPRRAKSEAA